jgi:hypothetical protein
MFGAFEIVYNGGDAIKRGVIGLSAFSARYFPPTGTVINDGEWHSVVVTYDGATLRIYVDGRLDNASDKWNYPEPEFWNYPELCNMAEAMNTGASNNIYLGRSLWEDPYEVWKGQLKNVRFYNCEVSNIAISVWIVC